MTREQFDAALKSGAFAWPGGYPLYFVMGDGEAVSFKAAEENALELRAAIDAGNTRDSWFPVSVQINWEDTDLVCAHSSVKIESAYGEDSDNG